MKKYIKDDIIKSIKNFSYNETRNLIFTKNFYTNKNQVNRNILCEQFITNTKAMPIYESIFYHTSFLDDDYSLKERIKSIVYEITEYPKCKCCGIILDKIFKSFCSPKCNATFNKPQSNMTTQEKKKMFAKMVQTRKKDGSYNPSEETKIKMSNSAKLSMNKKRKTNMKRYGVENPGVLGAYSSKAAENYILDYLGKNNIDINTCLFKHREIKEFFQMVFDEKINKHRYFSYDLVVFDSIESKNKKDTTKINLVLEYNGPWHYKKSMVNDIKAPATPYKNSPSIEECIYGDNLKLNHIKQFTDNILIFWEKTQTLESFPDQTQE